MMSARLCIRSRWHRRFSRRFRSAEHGLELVQPPAPLAHPLDDGTAAVLERSIDADGDIAGRGRGRLSPIDGAAGRPGRRALRRAARAAQNSAAPARRPFDSASARSSQPACWRAAGSRASRLAPCSRGWPPTRSCRWSGGRPSAVALVLGIAGHTVGWPIVRGGSQRLAESLAGYFALTRRRGDHGLAGRVG